MAAFDKNQILILGGYNRSGRLGDGILIDAKTKKIKKCFEGSPALKF